MRAFFGQLSSLANEYLSVSKLVVVLLVAGLTTVAYRQGMLDPFENVTLDQRFKMRAQQFTHPKIVLVEIAEDSINSIGRWPWNREWHATLVKALSAFGAKAIAFDVLFSEPSVPETDALFAQTISKAGNVYLPVAFNETHGVTGAGMAESIPSLRDAIRGEGHITIVPDRDGLLRRIKPRYMHEGKGYLQLGLKMAIDLYGVKEKDLVYKENVLEVPIPNNPVLKIPLTQEGDILLNWAGNWKQSFFHVSFIDVVVSYAQHLKGQKPRLPPDIFDDAICIVGVTATGLFDIRSIPLEPAYPAVGVNATVLNSVLERNFLSVTNDKVNLAILWIYAVIIFLVTLRLSYLQSTILIVTLAAAHAVLALLLFAFGNIVLNIVYPLFQILASFISLSTYHQIVITLEKRRLMKLATKDSMTGLFNIGHFKLLLNAELRSIKLRRNKDLSVIMVDVDFFKFKTRTKLHEPKILFVGNFKWLQDREAVMALFTSIWPKIAQKLPQAKLWIVGRFPSPEILHFRSDRVEVSDDIEDIRLAYEKSDVLLAPIYGPGGTRYKILEAMASGLPVVTTPQGIEGLEVEDGREALICKSSADLAAATIKLLTDTRLYHKLVGAGNRFVRNKFNWSKIAADLDQVYEEVAHEK